MVVGGRVHTGSFDREMSKCVSLCVSVSMCRCLALGGQGADVISVYLCVGCAVWPVLLAAGLALWPQCPGDQRVDVWGWMVSSITSLSDTSTHTKDRNKGPLENYLQSLKPSLFLRVSVWFYAPLWRISARPHVERAWKPVSVLRVGIVMWKTERASFSAKEKLSPWSRFSCWNLF